jgi:hypothetical protein
MGRQVASIYTGSNISLTIGETLIGNAFGISYDLSQNKRPIYGYNSMLFDAISTGQVIVIGQLYLTYQHANYLSKIMRDYYNFPNLITNYKKDRVTGVIDRNAFIQSDETGQVDAENTIREIVTGTTVGGAARQDKNYDELLNDLFNSPSKLQDYRSAFSPRENQLNGIDLTKSNGKFGYAPGSVTDPRNIQHFVDLGAEDSLYKRPDQFSNNSSAATWPGIDIVITYGDPKFNNEQTGILDYSNSFSTVLKSVHFIGESQQVMADDQPVMEVYKFIARDKYTLIRPDIKEEKQN